MTGRGSRLSRYGFVLAASGAILAGCTTTAPHAVGRDAIVRAPAGPDGRPRAPRIDEYGMAVGADGAPDAAYCAAACNTAAMPGERIYRCYALVPGPDLSKRARFEPLVGCNFEGGR